MSKKADKTTEAVLYIIAAALIMCCMSNLPVWANWAVRLLLSVTLGYGAYKAMQRRQTTKMLVLFILALLFQPFIHIPLGQFVWTIIKLAVIVYLIYLLYTTIRGSGKKKSRKSNSKRVRKS